MSTIYYRPEWTSGRYNNEHRAAIFYNLLEGMSYYFEDYSALVIGKILEVKHNETFTVEELSSKTGIHQDSITLFMEQLREVGLVTDERPTKELVSFIRNQIKEQRKKSLSVDKSTKEKLPVATTNAEQLYMDRVGGVGSVMFELTYRCSEMCVHCYNIGATRNDDEISHRGDLDELKLDDYKRIIDELYEQGLFKVCLSGGDPFSKGKIVWDIIEYLKSKDIAFLIYTNGQMVVDNVQRLAEYYPMIVGLSVYSGVPEVHDRITRIKGSWEKTMSVVRQLSDLAVTMEIKCCIMNINANTYYMVADLAKENNAVLQYEVNISDSVEGDKCASKYLRLSPRQLEVILRDDNIPLYVGPEAPNYGGQKRNMDLCTCGAASNSFCITPDGDLIPCCSFHLVFGNLKTQSFSEIIENSAELKEWQAAVLRDYEECGRYDYCDYCNLCAGLNYSEHGTYKKAGENNCHLAKARYDLAKKMMEGYDPLQGKTLRERIQTLEIERKSTIKRELDKGN